MKLEPSSIHLPEPNRGTLSAEQIDEIARVVINRMLESPKLLTIKQARTQMNVAERTFREWMSDGLIRTFRMNGVIRIDRKYLEDLIEQKTHKAIRARKPRLKFQS